MLTVASVLFVYFWNLILNFWLMSKDLKLNGIDSVDGFLIFPFLGPLGTAVFLISLFEKCLKKPRKLISFLDRVFMS